MIPNILSIAGSDPSGGAGIQADIKAISANGGYAMAALTALTAQNTQGVSGVHPVPPDFVKAQIEAVRSDIRVDAVKIGMIATADIASAVADALHGLSCPVVLDPVMVAKGGASLLEDDAIEVLATRLLPLATVLTPNMPELARLADTKNIRDRAAMAEAATQLLKRSGTAVLAKGGHLDQTGAPDLLLSNHEEIWLEAERIDTRNTHGTGCTLSSALAAFLGHGQPLAEAAKLAKDYVTVAIGAADGLDVGAGHGPLNHFPVREVRAGLQ